MAVPTFVLKGKGSTLRGGPELARDPYAGFTAIITSNVKGTLGIDGQMSDIDQVVTLFDSDGWLGGPDGIELAADDPELNLSRPLTYNFRVISNENYTTRTVSQFDFLAGELDEVVTLDTVTRVGHSNASSSTTGHQGPRSRLVKVSDGPPALYRWMDENGNLWGATQEFSALVAPVSFDDLSDASAYAVAAKQGSAWRNAVFAAPLASDTPVVTINAASQIGGGSTIAPTTDYFGDTHFRYDGAPTVETGTGGVQPPSSSTKGIVYDLSAETVLSSTSTVEFKFSTRPTQTSLAVRVIVDGTWVNTYAIQLNGLTVNTMYFVKLTFPTARPRRIKVEAAGMYRFGGVVVPSGGTAARPSGEISKRLVVLADSYGAGAGGNTTSNPATNGSTKIETFPHYVARMLECDSVINVSVGGTGPVNNGGAGKSTFGERIPEVLACNPHIVLIAGSINDAAVSATYDQVYAAVTAILAQLASVPVVILTGPERDTTASASYAIHNNAVRDASAAYNRIFVDTLDTIKGSLYNAADSIHPSAEAHFEVLAPKLYDGVSRVAVDQIVAATVAGRTSVDLTLTASPLAVAATGATVTLTATQSAYRAGVVDFYANGSLLATSTVSAGVATYATAALAAGSYTLYAQFRPTNPLLVKPAYSNTLAYTVAANLGFMDHFSIDGPMTTTENGKAWESLGTITGTVSGGVVSFTTTGNSYKVADAASPYGVFTGKIGTGSNVTALQFALRAVGQTNLIRLCVSGGQIVIRKTISNVSSDPFIGSTGPWAATDIITVQFDPGDLVTVKKNGTNVTGLVGVYVPEFNTATKFGAGHTTGTNIVNVTEMSFVAA